MTSTTSLFACAPADVTLERVRELAAQALPESLTLEYKERYSPSLVKSVAAMANTYGGIIMVGVADQPSPGRLTGVPESAVVQIANACYESMEPPWEPEIIPVPGFALRLVLGGFADEGVLIGQRAVPEKLAEAGFVFTHTDVESALRYAFDR